MSQSEYERLAAAIERLCMILASQYALQLGELDQNEKTERLSRIGFSSADIAALLGTTTNAVNVALHRARKRTRTKPRGRRGRS